MKFAENGYAGQLLISKGVTIDKVRKMTEDYLGFGDDEISTAILELIEREKMIAEGAGATSVAAAMFNKLPIKGKNVVCLVSGGNIDVTILSRVINRGLQKAGRLAELVVELTDKPGQLLGVSEITVRTLFLWSITVRMKDLI